MKVLQSIIYWLFLATPFLAFTQETLPIYSDYLSDNIFLIHPSAAGIGDVGKIRFTARNQWSGVQDAPTLQTLTAHQRFGENVGAGVVLFNDKNGYHSQQGLEAVFAYHINLASSDNAKQLSFALGFLAMNNKLDESSFDPEDPIISGIIESDGYFNADFSMAFNNKGFFGYFTAKNLIITSIETDDSSYESLNLRRYLLTLGYYFGNEKSFQFEPSVMGQFLEKTEELFMDFNIKVYKDIANAQLWAALSYRQGFNNASVDEQLQYFTPIVGINYKQFLFSYTYTKQVGSILFDNTGYHQITLGYNFGRKVKRKFDWRYHPNLYERY